MFIDFDDYRKERPGPVTRRGRRRPRARSPKRELVMDNSINGMRSGSARDSCQRTIPLPGCYEVLSSLISEDAGFECDLPERLRRRASFLQPGHRPHDALETAQLARNVSWTPSTSPWWSTSTTGTERGERHRTIYEVESRRVAAIQMEDQISPKRCGHAEGSACSRGAVSQQLAAALKARQTAALHHRPHGLDRPGRRHPAPPGSTWRQAPTPSSSTAPEPGGMAAGRARGAGQQAVNSSSGQDADPDR